MENVRPEPSVACGLESPLVPNEALAEVDEETGEIVKGKAAHENLHRCSLLWLGPFPETESQLAIWLRRIADALGAAWWVATWSAQTKPGIQEVLLERKLARQGATISRSLNRVAIWRLDDLRNWYALGIGGTTFVVTGSRPDPDDLAARFAIPIWTQTLHAGRMAPSRQLLDWLATTRRGLIYRRSDHVGHSGIVAITPTPLNVRLVVGDRHAVTMSGTAAQRVWLDFH
jgi:hypothetical protein